MSIRELIGSLSSDASISQHVTEVIKYVEGLLLFASLVFSITLCETLLKFQASCFDELSFFPRAGVMRLVKCDEGRFSSSVFTSWRRP